VSNTYPSRPKYFREVSCTSMLFFLNSLLLFRPDYVYNTLKFEFMNCKRNTEQRFVTSYENDYNIQLL
jgi:hypothetical protein